MGALDNLMGSAIDIVLEAMKKACWDTVAEARVSGSYTDRTGNLRSSIGYIIKRGGRTVDENFTAAGSGSTSGDEGINKARGVAERVSTMYGDQLVAVLVAGEDYAVYVESMGYEVISGSMLHFARRFEENFKAAGGDMGGVRVKKGVGNK